MGQHLSNMVLIDRALVCVPSIDSEFLFLTWKFLYYTGRYAQLIAIQFTHSLSDLRNLRISHFILHYIFSLFADVIPDENTALSMGGPPLPGQRVLPPHVVNKVQEIDGTQMVSPALHFFLYHALCH